MKSPRQNADLEVYSVHHWQASKGHPGVSLLDSGREDGDVDRKWFISSIIVPI